MTMKKTHSLNEANAVRSILCDFCLALGLCIGTFPRITFSCALLHPWNREESFVRAMWSPRANVLRRNRVASKQKRCIIRNRKKATRQSKWQIEWRQKNIVIFCLYAKCSEYRVHNKLLDWIELPVPGCRSPIGFARGIENPMKVNGRESGARALFLLLSATISHSPMLVTRREIY